MITIAGVKTLLSEVVQTIKTDPNRKWEKSFDCYLIKMNGQTYATMDLLMAKLGEYVTNEEGKTSVQLARARGDGSTGNSAMTLAPLARASVNAADVAAIASLMTSGNVGNGITNKSAHQTDPETGRIKGGSVSVSEFYVNGAAGRRATKRTEGTKVSYYYSKGHAANTYQYARLT
jgi:hypothetical protein